MGGCFRLFRAGDGMIGRGDAEAPGTAPKAKRKRLAVAIVAVDHLGSSPAKRDAQVAG